MVTWIEDPAGLAFDFLAPTLQVYRLIHRFPHTPDLVDEAALKSMDRAAEEGHGSLTLQSSHLSDNGTSLRRFPRSV
jgi:hypothetical protein